MDIHHLPDQGKHILQEQATQLAQKALTQPANPSPTQRQYRNTAPPHHLPMQWKYPQLKKRQVVCQPYTNNQYGKS